MHDNRDDPSPSDDAAYQRAHRQVQKLKAFYIHALVYGLVNAALFVIDMATPGGPWFFWPLLGWGVGLGFQAFATFGPELFGPDWERRKMAELMANEKRDR